MGATLLDSLSEFDTPELVDRLASQLGEPKGNVALGMRTTTRALLAALADRTERDPAVAQSVFDMVTDDANDGSVLNDPAALLGDTTSPVARLGARFVSSVFGDRLSAVTALLERQSVLRRDGISRLLTVAGPLVLAVLGRHVREGGLNASSFAQLLSDERADLVRAAPPGLLDALHGPEPSHAARGAGVRSAEPRRGPRVWAIFATVALGAILFFAIRQGRRERAAASRADTPSSIVSGGEVVTVPPGATEVVLPGGIALIVDASSPESRLVGFLRSPGAPSDTTWFVLDKMQFATNTATLDTSSQAQIDNVARILRAYGNAEVKIGGHTDNVGSDSANLRLSRDRAESVRSALVDAGVAPWRITAEGYGSRLPVADNSTEEGRARNRRIGLLVAKK